MKALAIACALLLLVACTPAADSRLVGDWNADGMDATNRFTFREDHTFTLQSSGMITTTETGTWRLERNQLIMDFTTEGSSLKGKHVVSTVTHIDPNTFTTTSSGNTWTFKRVK